MKYIYILICSFFIGYSTYGQCVDSTRIDPYNTQCKLDLSTFYPVCACNNVTYFSACHAQNNGGVINGMWRDGVCNNFFFDFYPNPVAGNVPINFFIQFAQATNNEATLMIIDIYGKVRYQRKISTPSNIDNFQIDQTYLLDTGIHFLLVQTASWRQVKKFVVMNF